MRWHWPIRTKLAPIADVTLCVCTFNDFGLWGSDLKNFSKTTDIFVAINSSVVVVKHWIVTWHGELFSCREGSLMTIVVSSSSWSDMGVIKEETGQTVLLGYLGPHG